MISTAHPDQGHRLGRRPRPGRHVLLPARLLGHRDLRAAVLHLHAAGDGPDAAQVPLPQPAGRAAEGGADGVPRRALPVGVRGQGHRDDAALRLRAERRAGAHPLRPHGAPHLGRRRLGRRGSTGRRPATTRSWRAWASRCCWRRRGSGSRAPRATTRGATTSASSWARTSTTRAWTTTPTPTCSRAGTSSARSRRSPGWRRCDEAYADELKKRLELTVTELFGWRTVIDGYVDGYDPETLLYEQFAGFYDMDDVPIEKLRPRPMAADLLLGRDVTLVSKVVKQADVVMLCHVLADEIDERTTRANYDYYEPITCHGSSLSPGIHAAVAARLHDVPEATDLLQDGRGDRPRRQHGQRGRRPAHGHHGWPVAGGRDGLLRRDAPRRGAAAGPAAAGGLGAGPPAPAVPRRAPAPGPPRPEERRGRGYNRREGAGHPAAGRARNGSSGPAVTSCGGATDDLGRWTPNDASHSRRRRRRRPGTGRVGPRARGGRALGGARRPRARARRCRSPGAPNSRASSSPPSTAIPSRRSPGSSAGAAVDAFAFGLSCACGSGAGLRDGPRRRGAAQQPRRSRAAGPAGHASRRRPQASVRAARGQPVHLGRHARRRRRALRARPRDRHAARRDRRHAGWRRAACRRRA